MPTPNAREQDVGVRPVRRTPTRYFRIPTGGCPEDFEEGNAGLEGQQSQGQVQGIPVLLGTPTSIRTSVWTPLGTSSTSTSAVGTSHTRQTSFDLSTSPSSSSASTTPTSARVASPTERAAWTPPSAVPGQTPASQEAVEGKTEEGASPTGKEKGEEREAESVDLVEPAISLASQFSSMRLHHTTCSSFLRPGACFQGEQTSEKQSYKVHVELKHIDLNDAFLCGYLRIQDLTDEHPTLTTYFEGEIIGPSHSLLTKRWGATERVDYHHWSKFPSLALPSSSPQNFTRTLRRADRDLRHTFSSRETVFMRWKEYFLVPDHRVKQIHGASFEGFYYVEFDRVSGKVRGYYFHAKSERDQKLDLKFSGGSGGLGSGFAGLSFR